MENQTNYIAIEDIRSFGIDLLSHYGVPKEVASDVLNVLICGEARGFGSHGLLRLPRVIQGIKAGTHCVDAIPDIQPKGPVCIAVNGRGGLGPFIAKKIMKLVIQKAKENGIAVATVHRMTHFGIAGYYSDMAAEENLIGMILCNTEPAASPFGGKKKVLGTNPIAFSCPRKEAPPITVDMATTAAARGKILGFKMKGEKLPGYIASGPDGTMTNDPDEALAGSLLPLGGPFGYKGTALAMMVDILTGALAGAATASRVQGTITTTDSCTAGYFFLAINPPFFLEFADFEQEIEALVCDMKASGPNVLLPGEQEHLREREAHEKGLVISEELERVLKTLGEECGIEYQF